MKSLYRWISEHSGLVKTLLFLLLCTFSFYSATLEYVSFLTIYLFDLLIWFGIGRFLATIPIRLLREPVEQFYHHCDPYPLMEETQRQLVKKPDSPQRQQMEVAYAITLWETGKYEEALRMLHNINIDKFPGASHSQKYTYYHNLCELSYLLGRKEEARIWHKKCQQIYRDIPIPKVKQELSSTYELLESCVLYYEENYEDALRKVAWIKLPNTYMVLSGALLAAKCHIALDEPEKAREKLNYVSEHGNKLHIVQEAKEILETLN